MAGHKNDNQSRNTTYCQSKLRSLFPPTGKSKFKTNPAHPCALEKQLPPFSLIRQIHVYFTLKENNLYPYYLFCQHIFNGKTKGTCTLYPISNCNIFENVYVCIVNIYLYVSWIYIYIEKTQYSQWAFYNFMQNNTTIVDVVKIFQHTSELLSSGSGDLIILTLLRSGSPFLEVS